MTTSATPSPSRRITNEVLSWPGTQAGHGSRGEFGFTVEGQPIGHLHGDRVAHFGFPRELGARLREEGRVGPHPVNRHSPKMASRAMESDADVDEVIALLRLSYDRIVAAEGASGGPA